MWFQSCLDALNNLGCSGYNGWVWRYDTAYYMIDPAGSNYQLSSSGNILKDNFAISEVPLVTNTDVLLSPGTYTIMVPATIDKQGVTYNFSKWEDSTTNPEREIAVSADATITAFYMVSTPTNNTTNKATVLASGTYTVTVTTPVTIDAVTYDFLKWEDNSTNPTRVVLLNQDTAITATYSLQYTSPVEPHVDPDEPNVNQSLLTQNMTESENTPANTPWVVGAWKPGAWEKTLLRKLIKENER